jgi:hypothetical protein
VINSIIGKSLPAGSQAARQASLSRLTKFRYYVHPTTGASQWEHPSGPEYTGQPAATPQPGHNLPAQPQHAQQEFAPPPIADQPAAPTKTGIVGKLGNLDLKAQAALAVSGGLATGALLEHEIEKFHISGHGGHGGHGGHHDVLGTMAGLISAAGAGAIGAKFFGGMGQAAQAAPPPSAPPTYPALPPGAPVYPASPPGAPACPIQAPPPPAVYPSQPMPPAAPSSGPGSEGLEKHEVGGAAGVAGALATSGASTGASAGASAPAAKPEVGGAAGEADALATSGASNGASAGAAPAPPAKPEVGGAASATGALAASAASNGASAEVPAVAGGSDGKASSLDSLTHSAPRLIIHGAVYADKDVTDKVRALVTPEQVLNFGNWNGEFGDPWPENPRKAFSILYQYGDRPLEVWAGR